MSKEQKSIRRKQEEMHQIAEEGREMIESARQRLKELDEEGNGEDVDKMISALQKVFGSKTK